MPGRATNEPSNYFALGKQSDKGTPASDFYFFKHLDGTSLERDDTTEAVREGGDGQEVGFVQRTAIAQDGSVVHNARPESAARMAAWTLGADSVSAASGSASGVAQIHTAVPTSSQPYLTAEQFWADVVERVPDVMSSSFQVDGEAGRPLKITNALVAGGTPISRPVASALTPTREIVQPFFYPGGEYTLTGASGAKMTKFSAAFTRTFDTDIRTTSLFREDVVSLAIDTSLSGTLKYEDADLYKSINYLSDGTIDPNAIGLATGVFQALSQFGEGADLNFFELGMPCLAFTGAKVNKLDPDGKTMYLDFTAMGVSSATSQFFTRISTPSGLVLI